MSPSQRLILFSATPIIILNILKNGKPVDFSPFITSKIYLVKSPNLATLLIDMELNGQIKGGPWEYKITFKGKLVRFYDNKGYVFWSGIVMWLIGMGLTIYQLLPSRPAKVPKLQLEEPKAIYDSSLYYKKIYQITLDSCNDLKHTTPVKSKEIITLLMQRGKTIVSYF